MYVVGLNHGEINSSAVLLKNGKIICGAPEERFTRQKFTKAFPAKSLEWCLSYAGLKLEDCDYVAQAWNPGAGWDKFNPILSANRIRREDNFYTIPDQLFRFTERKAPEWVTMDFSESCGLPPIYHITHHTTHAANAFYLSPFEEAAFATSDFRGEFETTTYGKGSGNKLEKLGRALVPNSLGMMYATFTELLGYRADNDEWKVMALSAFDVDAEKEYQAIRSTFHLNDDGFIELDQKYYKGAIIDQPHLYTQALVNLLGGRLGKSGEEALEWHWKIATAMQRASEEAAFHLLNHVHKRTKSDNLVAAGGFFMNSVMNGKILEKTPFKNVFISYAPSDVGNSIGAALFLNHHIKDQPRSIEDSQPATIGPSFTNQDAIDALKRRGISFENVEKIEEKIADLLSEGHVVAHFHGQMEFGDRALGNRSILADPRNENTKDKINSMIKYRESYRPFAPSTAQESVHQYFEVDQGFQCPYMEKVVPVKTEFRKALPAITHNDGSGRVQTVTKDSNPRYYGIIKAFEKRSNFPIVLNTSFNVNGEPIVLSPDDAISTFFNSGLTHLVIENCLIEKK